MTGQDHGSGSPEPGTGKPVVRGGRSAFIRILPGLIISLVSLAIVLHFADFQQFLEALHLANYTLLAVYFLISLVWLLVRAVVWRTLLQEKATFSQAFLTINEGYLLNNLLPFRLGEVGRSFLLSRKAKLPFFEVLSTIVIERSLDVAMAAGLLLGSLPFVVGASWALQAAIIASCLVILGLCVLYLLARNREWALRKFEALAQRWPALLKLGSRQLNAFLTGLAALTQGRRFLRVIIWMVFNWLIAVVQYDVLLMAYLPEARLLWATFSLGVLALGIAVPSSPGAVGVLELSLVGALSLFGVDASTSLAAAITAHLTNYLTTGVIGAFALFQDGLSLSDVYRDARSISSGEGVG
jgi:glycosyltransferase 2 family protein